MERFDLVMIGAGAAGITAAKTAADLGARVALADRGPLGGLCVNRGCIPKKALVTAARVHRRVREAAALGTVAGSVRLDWETVQRRQREVRNFKKYSSSVIIGSIFVPSIQEKNRRAVLWRGARGTNTK